MKKHSCISFAINSFLRLTFKPNNKEIDMNSIVIAKALSNEHEFAGRTWHYDFRVLSKDLDEKKCQKVAGSLLKRYSVLTKDWDNNKNSEWLCRTYLSAKMIMTATLQLNAIEYSKEKNLRLVIPYLAYYSLLSLLRGIVYTLPEVEWENGGLVTIGHKKAIDLAFNHISNIDRDKSKKIKDFCLKVKAYRELISYRSPSSGDLNIGSIDQIKEITTLLCEVAQFNSELLESSIVKNANPQSFVFLDSYIASLSKCKIEGELFFDKEDAYRLDYLKRKHPRSPNILHIMTEGHVEDFFGSWTSNSEEINENEFDPDTNWQLIFDIP